MPPYAIWSFTQPNQAEKLQTLIKAANVEDVESIWTTLFAKVRAPGLSTKFGVPTVERDD